jgi:hypothetical protein
MWEISMQPLDSKPYIVKPGDTLASIAKQFGFTNWTDIYNSPANSSLRKIYPNPNQLRVGEKIMIPPSAQQVRQVLEKRLSDLTQLRQQSDMMYQQILNEMDGNLKKYETVASSADAAATVATIFVSLTSIAVKGWSAMKLSGPALDAANKELAKQGVEFAFDPLKDPALRFTADKLGAHDGMIWVLGKLTIEDFLNIQSPSWWAGVYGNLRDGKSWSQAVTDSPQDQLRSAKQRVEGQRQQTLKSIDARINETRTLLNGVTVSGLVALQSPTRPVYA